MRLLHFEKLQPICPTCKKNGQISSLAVTTFEESQGDVISGLLTCTGFNCGRSYPIMFGCPILVPDLEAWLSTNLHLILQTEISDPNIENFISETVSPDLVFSVMRQQQSSYCADHYREEFSKNIVDQQTNNSFSTIRHCLNTALECMPANGSACIDIGCAVGGTTFDIATKRQALTIGIDLNWPLLGIARKALNEGVISYPHRIIGNRYERRTARVSYPSNDLCDFWVADANCLPFKQKSFGLAIGLNIIDCLAAPEEFLAALLETVIEGGGVSIACSFDWASHATPQKNWLYGEVKLDEIINTLIVNTIDEKRSFIMKSPPKDVEWRLHLHERSEINYLTRLYMMEVSVQKA